MKNGFLKRILNYFIPGLLITVPLAITVVVLVNIIQFISSLFNFYDIIIHPVLDPFIVLAVVFSLILLIGFLGSSIVFKPFFVLFEHAIEKAPVIKIIYTSIKDLLSAFVGNKKRFDKPVTVFIDKTNNIQMVGFITQKSLIKLGMEENKVAVYLPYSYGFMGKLIIVPSENVTPLNISASNAMKFILSGGVSDGESIEH